MDLLSELEAYRAEEKQLNWSGPFGEYFELVKEHPELARLSHARVYHMIMDAGVYQDPDDPKLLHYNFFERELYGLDRTMQQLVEYFSSASQRLEVRKRIMLLMGPVGGGKSTIVAMLKRGMEEYSRTEAGAVYAIKGCPMHEDPLHLLPESIRERIMSEYGIYIEGDLCPRCRMMVTEDYGGLVEEVPVERIAFSEKNRVGIGTFSPSDPKSQDITELTGSIDLATVGEYGSESDPRAYRFDGELNIANRGVMEFIEMLKVDEKFLYGLLTLTQEQNIKTGRFSMIYADEVILSHTNENEYNSFAGNKKSEALQDRTIVVKVPYNLKVSEEVKIYQKLLKQSAMSGVHIAPETLQTASIFAVLSRLELSKKNGLSLVKKMKLYNGEDVTDFTHNDLRELHEECPREGMDGISPRYVINRLSAALVKKDCKCLTPIDALRALRDGLDQHTGMTPERKEALLNLVAKTREEYDDLAKGAVQKAFVYNFEESAKTLLKNYLENVQAYCNNTRVRDALTDEELAPDENLMKGIEEQIGVNEVTKKRFREEIMIRLSSLAMSNKLFDYTSHPQLKEAIEKKLFADLKDIVKITTNSKTPDAEQLKRINGVVDRLCEEHGYCSVCANELLRYVGTLLNR